MLITRIGKLSVSLSAVVNSYDNVLLPNRWQAKLDGQRHFCYELLK